MGIIESALIVSALLLKPKKKRRKGKRKRTRQGINARRRQWESENIKLTNKALEDFAKAGRD